MYNDLVKKFLKGILLNTNTDKFNSMVIGWDILEFYGKNYDNANQIY